MGEFSIFHWLVVLAVVLIFFGGRRIPEVMKGLGEGIRSFKDGMSGMAGGAAQTATAAAPAPVASPTGITAKPGKGQVALSWSASAGASSYNVKRSGTSGGPYALIVSTGVDELHGRRIGERHLLLCSFLRRPEWRKHEFRGSERHACLSCKRNDSLSN